MDNWTIALIIVAGIAGFIFCAAVASVAFFSYAAHRNKREVSARMQAIEAKEAAARELFFEKIKTYLHRNDENILAKMRESAQNIVAETQQVSSPKKKKPFWTDPEQLTRVKEQIEDSGDFPTQPELANMTASEAWREIDAQLLELNSQSSDNSAESPEST